MMRVPALCTDAVVDAEQAAYKWFLPYANDVDITQKRMSSHSGHIQQ